MGRCSHWKTALALLILPLAFVVGNRAAEATQLAVRFPGSSAGLANRDLRFHQRVIVLIASH